VVTLEVPNVSSKHLGQALQDLEPTFISFVISFWLIAGFWIQHHQFARRLTAIDAGLMRRNLFFLFTITMISFGTALFGGYASNLLALIVYTIILVATGGGMFRLWHYAAGHNLVVPGSVDPENLDPAVSLVRTVIFLLAIPLGVVTPWAPLIWILTGQASAIVGAFRRLRPG